MANGDTPPYFTTNSEGKRPRFFIHIDDDSDDRMVEISASSRTSIYLAVHFGKDEDEGDGTWRIAGNANLNRQDFVDGLLVLFPELQYRTQD